MARFGRLDSDVDQVLEEMDRSSVWPHLTPNLCYITVKGGLWGAHSE